jgi:hypothetical protein
MALAYAAMAKERNLVARPWNPVARELTKLLGGKKTYEHIIVGGGHVHRLRVYKIPPATAASGTKTVLKEVK